MLTLDRPNLCLLFFGIVLLIYFTLNIFISPKTANVDTKIGVT